MIELAGVHASVGAFRLVDIQLAIGSGECHVIVGPTGSGKTFLLETLIGLRPMESGTIRIDGQDVTAFPPNRRQISYVPQDTCLFPTLTVRQNIQFGLDLRPRFDSQDLAFVGRLVDFLRLAPLLDRYPRNLSGGERQRVALARALATKPALLVLDEPFSAIDYSLREEIRRMIKDLLEEFKTTTLIVTHDLDEAFFLGDRISIILGGRIVQSGPRDEMYYHPKSLPAAEFLGIRNLFAGRVEQLAQHEITLTSPALERTFTVPCRCAHQRFTTGQAIRFGIRSEAVHILHHQPTPEDSRLVFGARVCRVFVRGTMHTLIVELATARPVTVEIDLHDAAMRKLGVTLGAELQVSLNPRHIFLLPEPT